MRIYTVHTLPGADALEEAPLLVREGFCWPAAIFTVFWALWHRMWLAAVLLFVAGLVPSVLEYAGANPPVLLALSAGIFLIAGFSGNDWRRAKLRRLGYRFEGVVAASEEDAALRRWYDLNPPDRALSVSSY